MNETTRHLEEKIAFLEHHVTEQDKVILGLVEDVGRLKRELRVLVARIAAAGAPEDQDEPQEERPPHY